MSAILEVLQPGAMTTVQDAGRRGYRSQGVPLAGVLDRTALHLVNALLGNDPDEAALEVRLTGPQLRVADGSVRFALGGSLRGHVTEAGHDRDVDPWSTVTLEPGATLTLRLDDGALVGTLGIAGGLDLPPVMGSRSTYLRAGVGGLDGRALQADDRLTLRRTYAPTGADRRLSAPFDLGAGPIRVLSGPQDDGFTAEALETLFTAEYEVTREMDRMGIRLSGPALEHAPDKGAEILSEGMVPGCIQVPGSGQPIVVLADGQTVGGYPKPGVVITADLPRLAALRPGDRIRFAAVTIEQAEEAARARAEAVATAIAGITEERLVDGYVLEALYGGNLIDGMVDMRRPDHFPGHLES